MRKRDMLILLGAVLLAVILTVSVFWGNKILRIKDSFVRL